MQLTVIAAVFVGGGLGAVSRYGITAWARQLAPTAWMPWGTLVANVLGCALLGLLAGLFEHLDLGPAARIGATTGVLGGLTTFSTFGYETVQLAQTGRWGLAGLNLLLNLAIGLTAAAVGAWLGHRLGLQLAH